MKYPNLLFIERKIFLQIDFVAESNLDEHLSYCSNLYIGWMLDAMQRTFDIVHENL